MPRSSVMEALPNICMNKIRETSIGSELTEPRRKLADIRCILDIHRGDLAPGWTITIWRFQLLEGQVRQSAAAALSNSFAGELDLPVSGRSICGVKEVRDDAGPLPVRLRINKEKIDVRS